MARRRGWRLPSDLHKPAETRFRHHSAKSGAFRRIEVLSTDPEFRRVRIAPRREPDSLSRRASLSRGSIAPGSRAFGSTPAAPRSGEPSTLGWLGRTLPRGFRPQDRAFARLTMPDRSARNGFYDRHSHFRYLQQASRLAFTGLRNAPLPLADLAIRQPAASVRGFSPDTFSARDSY